VNLTANHNFVLIGTNGMAPVANLTAIKRNDMEWLPSGNQTAIKLLNQNGMAPVANLTAIKRNIGNGFRLETKQPANKIGNGSSCEPYSYQVTE